MADDELTLDAIDIQELLACLPHRYPFLMIDKIRDVDGDRSGVGIKNVTINEPQFSGHFPGTPVMPGVLLVEGMAQTAGALCVLSQVQSGAPCLVYFMTIDKAKFRKPVVPGDRVEYHVKQIKRRGSIWKFSGIALVDDFKVAEAEFSAMLVQG